MLNEDIQIAELSKIIKERKQFLNSQYKSLNTRENPYLSPIKALYEEYNAQKNKKNEDLKQCLENLQKHIEKYGNDKDENCKLEKEQIKNKLRKFK
jgi:predicted DsbA family dithiol-disulfide isomerase